MINTRKMMLTVTALMIGAVGATHAATVNKVGWIGADSYLPFSLYSNVTTKDMKSLLSGHVFVAEFRDGRTTNALRIAYFAPSGVEYRCGSDARPGFHLGKYNPTWAGHWEAFTVWSGDHIKYPVLKFISPPKNLKTRISFSTVRYDPKTAGMAEYAFVDGRLLRGDTGRIQKELPAVTWKVCPDFPSAASLGATVDPRQTATTYDAVIAQGGTPIRRPDLVTAHTEQKY
ncbi:MAG: hypothetical protein KGN33_08095 [Paracoccaceae bacterium]|nr:hypothetical protein [Paracoccaceae bacterium]